MGRGWGWPGAAMWMSGKLAESRSPAVGTRVSWEDKESKGSSWAQAAPLAPLLACGVEKPAPTQSPRLVSGEEPCRRDGT